MRSLLLIRHGRSEYNEGLTTDLDSPIIPSAYRQTAIMADYLKTNLSDLEEWECLVSPYLRTLQTAEILHDILGLNFIVDDRPREIMMKYEKVKIPNRRDKFKLFDWESVPSQGYQFFNEELGDFLCRMQDFHSTIPVDGKFIVISHGSPIEVMKKLETLDECVLPPYWVSNSSLTLIENNISVWYNKVVY